MSRETTEIKEFPMDQEAEARAFAAKFTKDYWAYDGSATVWQEMSSGKWMVTMRSRDSCD